MRKRVIVNKIRCKKCGDIIESKHTHDLQYCKCGAIHVDGGTEYQRVGLSKGLKEDDCIDYSYSEYED